MVDETINNFYLVNAPAGSGKTTKIREMILTYLNEESEKSILYITYTNRAAEELKGKIQHERLFSSTIHTFLDCFLKSFFQNKVVVNAYVDCFREEICERIANKEGKQNIKASNEKYILENKGLSLDIIRENIEEIRYNETSNSAYYYGRLGHDDLLRFSAFVFEKFSKIRLAFLAKYKYVFLDEYQDTNDIVLRMFYTLIKDSESKMYIFGDKMQQIFNNYIGTFENEFSKMNQEIKLRVNHRSSKDIVNILNHLYNDDNYGQEPDFQKVYVSDFLPRILLTDDVETCLRNLQNENDSSLILYIANQDKFEEIGASNLYKAFNNIKKYGYLKKNRAADVLSFKSYTDNPDIVLSCVLLIDKIIKLFTLKRFGEIIQLAKRNPKGMLKKSTFVLTTHEDKKRIYDLLIDASSKYDEDITLNQFLDYLCKKEFLDKNIFDEYLQDDEYTDVFFVNISELKNWIKFVNNPNVSTQHGVKGESHDSVIFVANDSKNPSVKMYKFFYLLSKENINLVSFEKFWYKYNHFVENLYSFFTNKKINAKERDLYLNEINNMIVDFKSDNDSCIYYQHLVSEVIDAYLNNNTVDNLKKINKNLVFGVLQAYRLFYVGCSRARQNLSIIIKKNAISNFQLDFNRKMKAIGFEIQEK